MIETIPSPEQRKKTQKKSIKNLLVVFVQWMKRIGAT